MSYNPPPYDPSTYPMPPVPQPNRRPTSVTVIAIIAIIWGSLAILGGLCTIPQHLGVQFGPNPVGDAMHSDPFVNGFNLTAMAIAVVLGVTMLVGGIASLSLKPIGRRLLLVYAIIQIGLTLISIPVQIVIIYPHMMSAVDGKTGIDPAVLTGMRVGFVLGLAFGVVSLVWPVLILIFMTRPHVKAAFAGDALASPQPPWGGGVAGPGGGYPA